ncbi:MAG: superoxide dismutase, partial [Bacteroidales bacterium]|nr:superoxide dismutase [Bacteroidales bacterium]
MIFTLPPLPYAMDALEPVMSQETIEYHYGKHLQTYVDNLNRLTEGTPYSDLTLE